MLYSMLTDLRMRALYSPMQTWAMKKLFEGRQKSMIHTDARLKTITEFLAGIKVCR